MEHSKNASTNSKAADEKAAADVLFYVLNSSQPDQRELFLSKLLKTIWKQQRMVDIRFPNDQEAQRYDLNLWSFRPESFIHHALENSAPAPIQIYGETISQPCEDVLINMHPSFCEFHNRYQRTIEVLDQSEYLLEMGPIRWKQYQQAGIEPTIHKIGFTN
jgi:DNA polymerase-3 subunit chi